MNVETHFGDRQVDSDGERLREIKRARRHTLIVKVMRVLFPLTSVCVVGLYGLSAYRAFDWVDALPSLQIPTILPNKLTMDNPRYKGFGDDGSSYIVTAKTAAQDFKRPGIILLEGISGELLDARKEKTILAAEHGVYDSHKNSLNLTGQIDIRSSDGLHAKLKSAKVLTKSGIISSEEPVFVAMRSGALHARRMTLWQKKKEALFQGGVRARLKQPAKGENSKSPPTSAFSKKTPTQGMFATSRSPVDITSQKLKITNVENMAVFSGHVRAVQDDAQLATRQLAVHFKPKAGKNKPQDNAKKGKKGASPFGDGGQKVERIVAKYPVLIKRGRDQQVTSQSAEFLVQREMAILKGQVVIVSGKARRVSSDRALINQHDETVLLEGNVIVSQAKNNLRGRRLFIDRKRGRLKLSSPPGGGAGPGRISATLHRKGKPGSAKGKSATVKKAQAVGAVAFKTDPAAPINIHSDSLDVDNSAQQAVFHGSVVAKQGSFQIKSASLSVLFDGQVDVADPTGSGPARGGSKHAGGMSVKKITARKNVTVTSQTGQTATGDWAEFDVVGNAVELGGNVILRQGKNVVRGTRLRIDMATGRSVIETAQRRAGGGWSSTIDGKKQSTSRKTSGAPAGFNDRGGRPSAVFFPSQFNKKKKPKQQPVKSGTVGAASAGAGKSGDGPASAASSWSATATPVN